MDPTLSERRDYFRRLLAAECPADRCQVEIRTTYHDNPESTGDDCLVKATSWPRPPHRGMTITIEVWNPCSENDRPPKTTTSSTRSTTSVQPTATERTTTDTTSTDGG
ncbi:hypothetical protein ACQPZF_23900 [Actinosynnema sp. CS-041913]|uniref:hypothetical protein n=1 Tax=Actinosynnema sp. CS-041913 TaxID=3239917 RepID=UPI003D8E8B48